MSALVKFATWLSCLASVPATIAGAEPAATQEIVVRASLARAEIERILGVDNLDTLSNPRDIADAMSRIPRGRAPEDFWRSYQRHLDAWARFADAYGGPDQGEQIAAERAINTTFDEVERIARRYGARLPQPVVNHRS